MFLWGDPPCRQEPGGQAPAPWTPAPLIFILRLFQCIRSGSRDDGHGGGTRSGTASPSSTTEKRSSHHDHQSGTGAAAAGPIATTIAARSPSPLSGRGAAAAAAAAEEEHTRTGGEPDPAEEARSSCSSSCSTLRPIGDPPANAPPSISVLTSVTERRKLVHDHNVKKLAPNAKPSQCDQPGSIS